MTASSDVGSPLRGQLLRVETVLLPVMRYPLAMTIEETRQLRDLEAASLRLIAAGVGRPSRLVTLLGLPDVRTLTPALTELAQLDAIAIGEQDEVNVTPVGDRMIRREVTKSYQLARADLLHNAFSDEFRWSDSDDDEVFTSREAEHSGMRLLAHPGQLSPDTIESRIDVIQGVMTRQGLPSDDDSKVRPRRLVVGVQANAPTTMYTPAELRTSREPSGQLAVTLWSGGQQVHSADKVLAEMTHAAFGSALPLETAWPVPTDGLARTLFDAAARSAQRASVVGLTDSSDGHRLGGICQSAETRLILVHHFQHHGVADDLLIDELRRLIDVNLQLRVLIALPVPLPQQASVSQVRELLDDLIGGETDRVRVVEMERAINTVVVADDRHCFFSVPHFEALQHNRGVRYEQTYQSSDSQIVGAFLQAWTRAVEQDQA